MFSKDCPCSMGLKDTKAAFFEKMAGYTSDPDRELEYI
jgi:hypothetical protein